MTGQWNGFGTPSALGSGTPANFCCSRIVRASSEFSLYCPSPNCWADADEGAVVLDVAVVVGMARVVAVDGWDVG